MERMDLVLRGLVIDSIDPLEPLLDVAFGGGRLAPHGAQADAGDRNAAICLCEDVAQALRHRGGLFGLLVVEEFREVEMRFDLKAQFFGVHVAGLEVEVLAGECARRTRRSEHSQEGHQHRRLATPIRADERREQIEPNGDRLVAVAAKAADRE